MAAVMVASGSVGPPRHARRILTGIPYAELRQFRRVARYEPPRNRIGLLVARVLGRPAPTNPAQAVELWYIPTNGEGQVASGLPKP